MTVGRVHETRTHGLLMDMVYSIQTSAFITPLTARSLMGSLIHDDVLTIARSCMVLGCTMSRKDLQVQASSTFPLLFSVAFFIQHCCH